MGSHSLCSSPLKLSASLPHLWLYLSLPACILIFDDKGVREMAFAWSLYSLGFWRQPAVMVSEYLLPFPVIWQWHAFKPGKWSWPHNLCGRFSSRAANLQFSAAPFSPSIFIITAITLYIRGSLSCPVIQLLLSVISVWNVSVFRCYFNCKLFFLSLSKPRLTSFRYRWLSSSA